MPAGDRDRAVVEAYDALLASVAQRAPEIGGRPVVGHWPHVGSAYDGIALVGQALYGWPDERPASALGTAAGRSAAIEDYRRRPEAPEPLAWITTSANRTSPWWNVARRLAEGLAPGTDAPWYARLAWLNLYPLAPEDPPGNPGGALRQAQDPFVVDLLRAELELIGARAVIALVGPYWWPAGSHPYFAPLAQRDRPLSYAGVLDGRRWVVGWHPKGASLRGTGPIAYSRLIIETLGAM